jgi:hypothetical protein
MAEEYTPEVVEGEGSDLTLKERADALAEERRAELLAALREGIVADPFTMAVFGVTALKFAAAAAFSIALSVGTGLITRALTPRNKITTGSLGGWTLDGEPVSFHEDENELQ